MIIPRPQVEAYEHGRLILPNTVTVSIPQENSERIMDVLKLFLPTVDFTIEDSGMITFKPRDFDKAESYSLKTDSHGITILYSDFLGARNALATLVQLLTVEDDVYSVPFCTIEDYPSFKVRSFMLDLARGVGRKEEIKEVILRLALLKYNQIHLHLMDSQGVAWQSQCYPKLTGPRGDQYSMQFFKSLYELCVKLGLEVLPEIEVPAHNETILRCYPEFACEVDEETHPAKWVLCAGNDDIFTFYKNIIAELLEMFPNCQYIHIGGDEVHYLDIPTQRCYWDECPKCQSLGYSNRQEIYYYIINRVYHIVKSYGKKVAMWNDWIDISKPCPLAKDILIYFWRVAMEGRGPTDGCSMQGFLEQGYTVVNAHFQEAYLSNKDYASINSIKDWTPSKRPVTDKKYHAQILGGEACAWEFGNEERYRFYRFTLPAPMGMFADRMWNGTVCEYDEMFETALTRAVLGYKCPKNFNVYKLIGTIMLDARTTDLGIINDHTPDTKELENAILSMIPITVSDVYGHFAALYYTECLNWILTRK